MLNVLDIDSEYMPKDVIRESLLTSIQTLKSLGILALKTDPTKSHNNECIKYLTSKKFSNADKKEYIKEHYRISKPDDYIKNFIKTLTMTSTHKEQTRVCITEFYKQYCKIKHGSLLVWAAKEENGITTFHYNNMKTQCLWAITIILSCLDLKYNANEIRVEIKP